MVASTAPKQWRLNSSERVASFENWRQNLLYRLSLLQSDFKLFLEPNACWRKKTKAAPLRGLQDDDETIPERSRQTSVPARNHAWHFHREIPVQFASIPVVNRSIISQHNKKNANDLKSQDFCLSVRIDPDGMLEPNIKQAFINLHREFDDVFDPTPRGYNGAVGHFEAIVIMGPVQPPQRKGRVPQYSRNRLVELQQKFDELEAAGVFRKPEEVGIVVEYLNPSFLVNKPNGGSGLVTAFSDVGSYSKPRPSLMPNVDSTLRQIASWKYLIISDLSKAFFQIPLSKDSMRYRGVVTPFRGVGVYTRSAMAMPGSETALEELMCRVLGDFITQGTVCKLADDLYCGGDAPNELLPNWSSVLKALHRCRMSLSATKTIVAPRSAMILGWIWSQGIISASPHRIATLSTCSLPSIAFAMKSFLEAYKFSGRVIPNCADVLVPLQRATDGRLSKDRIIWDDSLHVAFTHAQKILSSHKTITIPIAEDQLCGWSD